MLVSIVVMRGCGTSGKGLGASLRFSFVRYPIVSGACSVGTDTSLPPYFYLNPFNLDVTLKHIDYQDVVPEVDTAAHDQSQTLDGAPITG